VISVGGNHYDPLGSNGKGGYCGPIGEEGKGGT
jgi:hypothetical protein